MKNIKLLVQILSNRNLHWLIDSWKKNQPVHNLEPVKNFVFAAIGLAIAFVSASLLMAIVAKAPAITNLPVFVFVQLVFVVVSIFLFSIFKQNSLFLFLRHTVDLMDSMEIFDVRRLSSGVTDGKTDLTSIRLHFQSILQMRALCVFENHTTFASMFDGKPVEWKPNDVWFYCIQNTKVWRCFEKTVRAGIRFGLANDIDIRRHILCQPKGGISDMPSKTIPSSKPGGEASSVSPLSGLKSSLPLVSVGLPDATLGYSHLDGEGWKGIPSDEGFNFVKTPQPEPAMIEEVGRSLVALSHLGKVRRGIAGSAASNSSSWPLGCSPHSPCAGGFNNRDQFG